MGKSDHQLSVFPAFFKVEDRTVLIAGGGKEAFAKARLLSETRARIIVHADRIDDDCAAFLQNHGYPIRSHRIGPDDLAGAALLFAATGDAAEDTALVAAARQAGVPANAVDRPELCDFYTPALINRAPVAVAIGTEGAGPVLGQILRGQIEAILPKSLGPLARLARTYRLAVERLLAPGAARRDYWHGFFTGDVARQAATGDLSAARKTATKALKASGAGKGYVWLVGAGPGAEDLLTLRAQRALQQADVIVHDALVPDPVIAMGRRDADRIAAGKRKGCHSKSQDEINRLLVDLARQGKRVVRLKSGDPLVFGRAGEEMAALRAHGISFEIVPGVTSALAAAADAQLPVTLRGVASSMVLTTGHDLHGDTLPDWAQLALDGATIAVYMGKSVAASVAARLMTSGMAHDTPVFVVENAGREDRRMFHGTLKDLPALESRDELTGPVMVLVGEAVSGADLSNATALRRSFATPFMQAA